MSLGGWTEVFATWTDDAIRQALIEKDISVEGCRSRDELLALATQVFASDFLPDAALSAGQRRASAITTSADKRGYLWKQAVSGKKRWQRRLFELSDEALSYSKVKHYRQGHSSEVKGRFVFNKDFFVVEDVAELDGVQVLEQSGAESGQREHTGDDEDEDEDEDERGAKLSSRTLPLDESRSAVGLSLAPTAIAARARWDKVRVYVFSGAFAPASITDDVALEVRTGRARTEADAMWTSVLRKIRRQQQRSRMGGGGGGSTPSGTSAFQFALVTSTAIVRLACESANEKAEWVRALRFAIERCRSTDAIGVLGTTAGPSGKGIKRGYLVKRAVHSGDNWKPRYFVLTGKDLQYFEAEHSPSPKGTFQLSPDCTVHLTRRQFTFKLVTPAKVLDVRASSQADMDSWIASLRAGIQATGVSAGMDPIAARAMTIGDAMYDIVYNKKCRIGLQTQKRGNWAVVNRLMPGAPNEVQVGDVITRVNGQSVVLATYEETLGRIKGWQPPLKLTMRRAPTKAGVLSKKARGQSARGRAFGSWKQRHFVLAEGKLTYYDSEGTAKPKGAVDLEGSAVSFVRGKLCDDKPYCISVVTASTGKIVLMAANEEQRLDWAAWLYYAIAVANGGRFLLDRERQALFTHATTPGAQSAPAHAVPGTSTVLRA